LKRYVKKLLKDWDPSNVIQVDSEICYTFMNFPAVWILNSKYKT